MTIKVVLDTNILVAAVFNRGSHAARLLQAIEKGEVNLVWDQATLAETRRGDQPDSPAVVGAARAPLYRRIRVPGSAPRDRPGAN